VAELMIHPGLLRGRVTPPPSKSDAHRALIAAALAGDLNLATGMPERMPDDLKATRRCLLALAGGATQLDCGESGTTLRLLIPVAAALGAASRRQLTFSGSGRLPNRPLDDYLDIFRGHGIDLSFPEGASLPLMMTGRLSGGTFRVPGHVSSQYISGLLFALPLLKEDSVLQLTTPLESAPYVAMTLRTLRSFGIVVHEQPGGYHVPGNQRYRRIVYHIERDYSQAAFWLVAAYTGSPLEVCDLDEDTAQGDKAIVRLLAEFGNGKAEHQIDAADIPDLVPPLAVAAALTPSVTRIIRAGRLRLKESDRLQAIAASLAAIGADIEETGDGLLIRGCARLRLPGTTGERAGCLRGGAASSFSDHRIAMALSIAALSTRQGVRLQGAEAVNKSYPEFFHEFSRLGGELDELGLGTSSENKLIW
jgi:3-phosphoshikimate 1-carboxyvinyltransferase